MSLLSIIMQAVFFLLVLAVSALGKPLAFRPRDAISPPITNPTATSVWKAGDTQTVVWDLSGLNGAQPSNPIGKILLGTFIDGEEHLMVESPIASGFNILDGNVTLTVPTVTTGSDYIVCLFGSSGDISAPFTIIGTDASSSASASSASTQLDAASSSNTLPPHETTDPSTSISLPHGVPVTSDPSSSAPTTTAVVSVSVSSSGTPAASSTATAPGASSTGTGTSASSTGTSAGTDTGTGSGTETATAAASSGTGNSGVRVAAGNVPLWSAAVSGALALFALL